MRTALVVFMLLIASLLVASCHALSASTPQSMSGNYAQNWIGSFGAQNPQSAEKNQQSDLWTWGGAPKGSIIVNGRLVPDPYYFWKSLNYTSGWLGKAYVDPNTGNPVSAYIEPYTGRVLYFYVDPNTRKPVYLNAYPVVGNPYYGGAPPVYPYRGW